MNGKHQLSQAMFVGAGLFLMPLFQEVTSVDAVFEWWYSGLAGLGGWALLLAIAIIANIYIFVDSQRRGVSAFGWKLVGLVPILLILPTLMFRYAAAETQASMLHLRETFFFMGLVGGIVPIAAAVGYAINYSGYVPEPSRPSEPSGSPVGPEPPPPPPPPSPPPPPAAPPPRKERANGWLIDLGTNQNYQLFKGDTQFGRGSKNDYILENDKTVSRSHILIREERGQYTLHDMASKTGVVLNDTPIAGPETLSHGDLIIIGETRLQFVTNR